MKLDIGCGHKPEGDVNIDLYTEPTAHRSLDMHYANDTKLTGIPNLIKAECTHLPIKDSCFDIAISKHLIEHIEEPLDLLLEMKRVTKLGGLIKIETPHKFGDRREWSLHKWSFTESWFLRAFKILNLKVVSSDPVYRILPINLRHLRMVYDCVPSAFLKFLRVPVLIRITGKVNK